MYMYMCTMYKGYNVMQPCKTTDDGKQTLIIDVNVTEMKKIFTTSST